MIPIVTPEEMAAIDAAAPEPVEVLIGRAGAALARAALDLLGGAYGRRVVVLAGKGNNGNDGRVAADRLRRRGMHVQIVDADGANRMLPTADLVIDAAFGTGLRGTFDPPHTDAPVLACDIPSGVDGLTGEILGDAWPAVETVTFAALKPGLLLHPGVARSGTVTVADIGLDAGEGHSHLVDAAAVGSWLPGRPTDAHKWRSACWVIGGSPGMSGAPRLAAAAAMRSGAGYVRLSVPGRDIADAAPASEVVTTALPDTDWASTVVAEADRFGAVVIGPGLGRSEVAARQVRTLAAEEAIALVVDGDGLRALSGRDPVRQVGGRPLVLTPHDGEFEALTGHRPGPDRFAEARDLAARLGAVVLLKGPCTIVAEPGGRTLAVDEGDERLATAGTGDVLSGIIGALLARGIDGMRAAAAAAFLHARAGAVGWRHGLIAGDLIDNLPTVFDDLLE